MPLTLTKADAPALCQGSEWVIADIDALAEQVARIAVGQYRHVARILLGGAATDVAVAAAAKADAIGLLTVKPGADPWHRDGWVFQAISWIAAHHDGGAAIKSPHLIKAHKGFDGLKLDLGPAGEVLGVIVFEDKATDNPRDTIRDDVWPGIAKLERGERSNELTQEVSGLLEGQLRTYPDLDIDAAVQTIIWKAARRYRVAITVSTPHATDARRQALFKGYDAQAPGDVGRRGAETLHVTDLRPWMQGFADLTVAKVQALPGHV